MVQTFPFLERITNRMGYIVVDSQGTIVKSDGDLLDSERHARVICEILCLDRPPYPLTPKRNKMLEMTVDYKTHYYTIARSGKYAFCVKRRRIPPPQPPVTVFLSSGIHQAPPDVPVTSTMNAELERRLNEIKHGISSSPAGASTSTKQGSAPTPAPTPELPASLTRGSSK